VRARYPLVAAAVFPTIFPSLVDPTTVKWWLAKTNVYRVVQSTHPLRQCMLRTGIWRVLFQSAQFTKQPNQRATAAAFGPKTI